MERLSNFLSSKATGRNVLVALGLLVLCIGLFNVALTPMYQQASSGFVPFDIQFPLTREMIIIQLGAMGPGSFAAYARFAALDMAFPLIGSGFTVLFWAWLVQKSGSAMLLGAFQRGWWIWAVFPAVCDLSENFFFLKILATYPEPALDAIEIVVDVHRGKLVFLTISQGATVALVVISALIQLRRKPAP
jgi:hypothetical protein